MRRIEYIVIHCTATTQNAKISSIKTYWKNVLNWNSVGYHFIIRANGIYKQLTGLNSVVNGVKGHNKNSIHVAYIGGLKGIDNRTNEQKQSMFMLIEQLLKIYPDAKLKGHRDFKGVKKECPSFDVVKWFNELKEIEQLASK